MASSLLTSFAAYCRNGAAAASIEFVILAPVMVLLGLGAVDTARYVIATEEINDAVRVIAQMVTENTSGSVNDLDLQFYRDATMIVFPDVLADARAKHIAWSNDISINISSVRFTATPADCTTSCSYKANVIWTSGNGPRPCGVNLSAVPDTSPPSPATLPTDVYGPGSIIVVDARYDFTPWFASAFIHSIPIARSAYVAPRYVPEVDYAATGDGVATSCP